MFQSIAKLFSAPADAGSPSLKARLGVDGMEDRFVPAVAAGVTVAASAEYFTLVGSAEPAPAAAIKGSPTALKFAPVKDAPAVMKFSPVKLSPVSVLGDHGLIIQDG